MIIYAAINRHLASIPIELVKEFEKGFYDFMATQYPKVGKSIKETGIMDDDAENQLREALRIYKKEFSREYGLGKIALSGEEQ